MLRTISSSKMVPQWGKKYVSLNENENKHIKICRL